MAQPFRTALDVGRGPFRAADLSPGDRYELHDGHAIYCAPTGGDGARGTVAGAHVLDTDPAVKEAGIDPGFASPDHKLRAPDIAVGNVPDKPGWIAGVPPLGVEYAGSGQDEDKLQEKIADLLQMGTRWIWVVRLVGPRRVEVHERGAPVRTFGPGEELRAPGVLQNAVPVEALYDRGAAHEVTLRNLLQRRGFRDLDAVLEKGREEGRDEGLRDGRAEGLRDGRAEGIRDLCDAFAVDLTPEREAALSSMSAAELDALRARLKRDRRWE